jgi:hypothetical protein
LLYTNYLLWQVCKKWYFAELVKVLRIIDTVNSYNLLFPGDSYMLRLPCLFALRAYVLCIENLCNTVSKDPWIILVTHFIQVNNSQAIAVDTDTSLMVYPLASKNRYLNIDTVV